MTFHEGSDGAFAGSRPGPRTPQLYKSQRTPSRSAPLPWSCLSLRDRSVPVMLWLVRPRLVDAEVARLGVGQFGKLSAELAQLQSRHLLVEVLWQHIDAGRVLLG